MIRNYILIAWRNFTKHRTYSLINVTGFSLAMVSCFLIVFHIQNELSYDRSFPKYKTIYRVHPTGWANSSPPMSQALLDYFPEIKSTVRFYDYGTRILRYNDNQVEVNDGYMVDSSAIDLFNLEFVAGTPGESLRAPYTLVLTESLAKKLFGREDPLGKIIKVNNNRDYSITGVIRDLPENTHLRMAYLISFSTLQKMVGDEWMNSRGWAGPYTYVEMNPDDLQKVLSKLTDFRLKFYEGMDTRERILANFNLEFQPMQDIHLYSHLEQEMGENSNAGYLYIFGVVAISILFIASVNFINLNISLAFRRMKETGMRKVMGAFRWQLVRQYMTETLMISFFAFFIAMVLFFTILPRYNDMTSRTIQYTDVFTLQNFAIMCHHVRINFIGKSYLWCIPCAVHVEISADRFIEGSKRSGLGYLLCSQRSGGISICCLRIHDCKHDNHLAPNGFLSEETIGLRSRPGVECATIRPASTKIFAQSTRGEVSAAKQCCYRAGWRHDESARR
jgi:putative ABC transport system permease protein